MKTMYLTSLMLLLGLAACSGANTTQDPDGGASRAELKKRAAENAASGDAPTSDVCGDNDWYGDGQCDTFCRDADTVDCAPDCGGGVVCALFVESPDGYCSRRPDDPCISQDPDCGGNEPPSGGDDPIACPAIAEIRDGVCGRPETDPCRSIDPDCSVDKPGRGEPTDPIACAEYIELPDDVCGRDPADPCMFQDPDCVRAMPAP